MSEFFLACAKKRNVGTLSFEGVLPLDPEKSFDSLEKAIKVLEESGDPRGWLIVEVFSPQIEMKVTLDDATHQVEATKKA